MITKAIQITIFVKDQEEAKKFYTEKLGFEVRDEIEGFSYLTVAPNKKNETVIELVTTSTPEEEALIGKQAGQQIIVMFESNNIQQDYTDMLKRGVVFNSEPLEVPGGRGVRFEDLYGNKYDLFQPENI